MRESKLKKEKNLQFINSLYFRQQKLEDGTLLDDVLYIIYKDLNTRKKGIMKLTKPNVDIYVLKEEYINEKYEMLEQEGIGDYYESFVKKENCDKIRIPYADRNYEMALILEDMGFMLKDPANNQEVTPTKWFYSCIKNKMPRLLNSIHQKGNIFYSSDYDIEDFYKSKFLDKYGSKLDSLTKGYYDIEVDAIRGGVEGFPSEIEAQAPVNAITFVNSDSNDCFTYLLRDPNNPLIENFEGRLPEFINGISEEFKDYGDFKYTIKMYDKEIDLIKGFFDDVNRLQPDFMLGWNTKFDIVTLINRITNLGFDPLDIIPHPDFDDIVCKYHFDFRHSTPEERNDFFECSSYSIWADQYLLFTQLRKGLGKRDSYTLNAISREELGDEKLDYSESGSIAEMIYKDWDLFVRYNIKDVLLCAKLEEKNEDATLFYTLGNITRTRTFKAMKKTISIKNLSNKFYYDEGYIQGNNMNMNFGYDEEEETEKYDGALVANPNNNTNVGKDMFGKLSKFIFDLVIDYDLSALYPSIIRAFNIDTSTQYGRIYIDKEAYNIKKIDRISSEYIDKEEDAEDENKRFLGGELLEDYNGRDYNYMAIKWAGMPTLEENIVAFNKFLKEGSDSTNE